MKGVRDARREEGGFRGKGTGVGEKVKGHKSERRLIATTEERRKAMEGMPELIRDWKLVSSADYGREGGRLMICRKGMARGGRSGRNERVWEDGEVVRWKEMYYMEGSGKRQSRYFMEFESVHLNQHQALYPIYIHWELDQSKLSTVSIKTLQESCKRKPAVKNHDLLQTIKCHPNS